jgi:hypothetical protein
MPQELLPLASISDYKASHERALSRDRVDAAGPSSSFIGGKRVEPRGEAWRLSQRSLVDESSL